MIRAGTIFVDTNVLVYARDRTDEDKHLRATEWMAALWDSGMGRLSWQVLHEYYYREHNIPATPSASKSAPGKERRRGVALRYGEEERRGMA